MAFRPWSGFLLSVTILLTLSGCAALGEPPARPGAGVDPDGPASGAVAGAGGGPPVRAAANPAPPRQVHADWGLFSSTGDGEMATQSVLPGLVPRGGDSVYAPTMKPPGGSCIEVVTAYNAGGAAVWAWNWCARRPGPAVVLRVDAAFLRSYTTEVAGHPAYTVSVLRTDPATNAWTARLYNYRTRSWNTMFTSSGQDHSGLPDGWDIFEIYTTRNPATGQAYYCSNAAGMSFDSSDILLRDGSWRPESTQDSVVWPVTPKTTDFACGSLSFRLTSANNHWLVRN